MTPIRCIGVHVVPAVAAAWLASAGPAFPWGREVELVPAGAPTYTFEQDVPVSFAPERDSILRLNHRYYRSPGDTSLRWDWESRDTGFTIRTGPGDLPVRRDPTPATGTGIPRVLWHAEPAFSCWLFTESPLQGMVSFAFLDGHGIRHQFLISLDYTGWRRVLIPYPPGLPETVDRIRITPPPTVRRGTLYFDNLRPWVEHLHRREAPPRTTPWPTPGSPDWLAPTAEE